MTPMPRALWTIDELGVQVSLALATDYDGPPNGRVRDVPDRRTIRYYTTLGLLDRPAELRGRTALYGRRHLLQLVAIKRLQARGLSLAEVQGQLLGLTDSALARIARLPADTGESAPAAETAGPDRRAGAFWSAAPAAVAAAEVDGEEAEASLPLQGVRIGEEVTLLVATARPVEENDIEAIRVAAAPLIKLLERRRLLRRERGTS